MGSAERRAIDKAEWLEAEAFGQVSAYCSTTLKWCGPDDSIGAVLPAFEEVTGLPVLDSAGGIPVGVVSEKDVLAYLQQYGDDTSHLATPVKCVHSARRDVRHSAHAGLNASHTARRARAGV